MAKKNHTGLKFCKGDVAVIFCITMLAVVIGCVFIWLTGTGSGECVAVYKEGEKVQELSLHEDREILIENSYTNKLRIKNGKVAIVESDCPGTDCVHSGWIREKGRSIVCLPNRVEIRIEGETESEVDFIVR